MTPFGRRSAPSTPGEYLRSAEYDLTMRAVADRYLGTARFSRDEGVRGHGLRCAAAFEYRDREGWGLEDAFRVDDARRINAVAQLANSLIDPSMQHAEIQPKLSTLDGRFPRDFEVPRRVGEVLGLSDTVLDRILHAYHLPLNSQSHSPSRLHSLLSEGLACRCRGVGYFGDYNLSDTRRARLFLLEYLGVDVSGDSSGRLGLGLGGNGRLEGGLGGGRTGGCGVHGIEGRGLYG